MTLMQQARAGQLTEAVKLVAASERIDPEKLREQIACGEVIIPVNTNHRIQPVGIGSGLRTKVNANIGTSTDASDVTYEIEKAKVAVEAGADAIMDLSTGGNVSEIRRAIMKEVPVLIGTVPIYQAAIEAIQHKGGLVRMTESDLFRILEQQAEEGVDFFTVHCGVTTHSIERLKREGRLTDIVSRGGSFLATWIIANEKENPLYTQFDRLLDIAEAYDITLSLGDGLRPGALADATDRAQIDELLILGELTQEAWSRGIQVMIEGPGHVPLNQIVMNIELQKRICHRAPFYVLGPLVTDIAPGYDHITAAIGGAVAASAGADFLCYVTPSEHLKLPDLHEVKLGVIASRIAAHSGDIAKGVAGALDWDISMAKARKALDWESQLSMAIDPNTARKLRETGAPCSEDVCSMCGQYCAIQLVNKLLRK
jgi:phosphomethylpyrimidine synthase